jgi:neutral ceramidase
MYAGTAKVDITPRESVWMDGMIRSHPSTGIHDTLFARALVLGETGGTTDAFALVSVDVCVLDEETTTAMRHAAAMQTGIPADHIIVAATHTHSAPAAVGIFNKREEGFVHELIAKLPALIEAAAARLEPVRASVAAGREESISHYRRLLADDGHVVMNWEPFPPERIVRPLGTADDEVGVVKLVAADRTNRMVGLIFNHAGHPNILSGENYLLSAEYPGLAAETLEATLGGVALFFNGAQGSVDIDGLRHRDWEGMDRAGRALAQSVTAASELPPARGGLHGASVRYEVPGRRVTAEELRWADEVLASTGGSVRAMADGIGDDYKALFLRRLAERGTRDLPVEQVCLAVGGCALLSFPGELYTEIGLRIKRESPFRRTYILGLANGYVGYVPTAAAIEQGGYAEDTRLVDSAAEQVVVDHSLTLLRAVHAAAMEKGDI